MSSFFEGNVDRRELLKRGAGGLGLLTIPGLVAACGGSAKGTTAQSRSAGTSPGTSTGPSDTGTPVKGGTLTVATVTNGNAETIDVRKVINTADYLRSQNLLDPLFFTVPGGTTPGLATSAEPNKDATAWTLKLRDGVHWHDGKPFTADDVVFTIKTWGSAASSYKTLTSGLIDFKGIRKLDQLTVRVPLLRPMATFEAICSWFTAYVVQNGTTDFNKPIGTGPFKYESFTPGSTSTFIANPEYWRGAPHVDKLVVNSSFTDDPARLNALLAKQVDIVPGVPPQLAKAHAGAGGLILGNAPGPGFQAVCMRVNQPPFDDPRVVQAFKLLTNRPAMVTDAFDGYATPGNDCVAATLKYWDASYKPPYDPEKAKSLLKAAGHEGLSMPLVYSAVVPGMAEVATLWSSQAAAAGVKASLKQLSPSVYYTSSNPGYTTNQRPLSVNYWNVMPASLGAYYLTAIAADAEYPETGWGLKPSHNKLINQAVGEMNPSRAADLWHAVQQQQIAEGGYIIAANTNYVDAYVTSVHGVETNASGDNANYTYYKAWIES